MSDENCAEHCLDERHMICDHCEVLMNFNNCRVFSEVYDTLTANLSAIFQMRKLQLILAESVDFNLKLFIKKRKALWRKHIHIQDYVSFMSLNFWSYNWAVILG